MEKRIAKTKGELAKAVVRHRNTITTWTKHPDWPFGPKPPYPVDEVITWVAENIEGNGVAEPPGGVSDGSIVEKRWVEILLKREQIAKTKIQRQILAGQFVRRDLMDDLVCGLIGRIRSEIEGWIESLPPRLNPGDPRGARAVLAESYDHLCGMMGKRDEADYVADARKNPAKIKAGKARRKKAS